MRFRMLIAGGLVLLAMAATAAEPPEPLDSDAAVIARVRKHLGLRNGGIGLINSADGKRILVAVGTADLLSQDPAALTHAEKEAELEARVRIAGFLSGEHVTAMARSSLKVDSSSSEKTPRVAEGFEERLSSVVDSRVLGVRLVGTYQSADRSRVHAAVILDEQIRSAVPIVPDGFPLFPRAITTQGSAMQTDDPKKDFEQALEDALLRAQWCAGGALIYSVRQRGDNRPFRYFDQVQASGRVDSFTIAGEFRDGRNQYVVIRAVVITDPVGLSMPRGTAAPAPRPATQPAARQAIIN